MILLMVYNFVLVMMVVILMITSIRCGYNQDLFVQDISKLLVIAMIGINMELWLLMVLILKIIVWIYIEYKLMVIINMYIIFIFALFNWY